MGKIVEVIVNAPNTAIGNSSSNTTLLGTLPEGYRPSVAFNTGAGGAAAETDYPAYCIFKTNGQIMPFAYAAMTINFYCHEIFLVD